MAEQKRGRSIAMSSDEVDAFLSAERTCRVASISADGPHVSPLWFVWDGESLWLNSTVRSQRWRDLERDPRVSVVIDAGEDFTELRGVELRGSVKIASEVPRTAEPLHSVREAELLYAEKYSGSSEFTPDGRHAWLRLDAPSIVSWDFRKNRALQSRRQPAVDSPKVDQ